MILTKYFFIAFVLSALGTVPMGLITLTIAQKNIEKGKAAAWMVALGATVMEFLYTVVALISLDFFSIENSWGRYIKIAAVCLFFALGFYYLLKKNQGLQQVATSYNQRDFFYGLAIGTMNMLVVPFWVFVGAWLKSNGILLYPFNTYW